MSLNKHRRRLHQRLLYKEIQRKKRLYLLVVHTFSEAFQKVVSLIAEASLAFLAFLKQ